ncbi:MAG: nucleotide exchange factor GrpE [Candidatus Hydrogenedentes bacterium]|nr:nucleotide exchange factor GrpE [Candidatus Hydrogenedentota bacterium]
MSKQPGKTELEKRLEAEAAREAERAAADETGGAAEAEGQDAEAVAALIAERDELRDQLLRARAEFDNSRKRMAREAQRTRKSAAEGLIRDLLPALDHLDLALQHAEEPESPFAQGVELVLKQFCEALGRHGVSPIPAVGERFDPTVHEAVMQRASEEVEADVVLEEFQRGYMLADRVLRPSKVVVSGGRAQEPDESGGDEEVAEGTSVRVEIQTSEEDNSDEGTALADL